MAYLIMMSLAQTDSVKWQDYQRSGTGIGTDVQGSVDGLILDTNLILALEGLKKMVNSFSVAISGLRFENDGLLIQVHYSIDGLKLRGFLYQVEQQTELHIYITQNF